MNRQQLKTSKRWVIKIGSALLTNDGRGLDKVAIQTWVEQIAKLHQTGAEVILVSSGAVAEGMTRLNWKTRPNALHHLQAAAAVGQMGMVQNYESCFKKHDINTAQILLTHDDLSNRQRYLNARSTLRALLDFKILPIINENDTVATEEIRFGDNDSLAALVANLIEADLLILLTDQKGLYDSDPRINSNAKLIQQAEANDPKLDSMASAKGGNLGSGGMFTKLRAAKLAARSGAATVIASGRVPNILSEIFQGEGTLLLPNQAPIAARKQWLASHLQMKGCLYLDQGAVKAVTESGKSLLAVGITKVEGKFSRGDMVACLTANGEEIARGLINYNHKETRKILGHSSHEIEKILNYIDQPEVIHRDNLVVL